MTTTTRTTPLVLTPDQHAEIRACLTALMAYAAWQRDCRPTTDADDTEAAHRAALAAADALDLLDSAATEMAAIGRKPKAMDWARRVDGRVKH